MKKRTLFIVIIVASLGIYGVWIPVESRDSSKPKENLAAEQFIQKYLVKGDGRIQTDLLDQKDIYLSETVGLWMDYLLEKNDNAQFRDTVDTLKKYFLTKHYLVAWELRGNEKAPANAFIDDLRIMAALYRAGEKWNHPVYTKLAENMEASLLRYQTRNRWFVDHIDLESKYQGDTITLSYIIPDGFEQMQSLPEEWKSQTKQLLVGAPASSRGFYPKSYNTLSDKFSFDTEVNLIDQFYVGYHRAQWNGDVEPLLKFAKSAFAKEGKLYGRYSLNSGEPVVAFEAAAVYALAILMCLELGEHDFARQLYHSMKEMQQLDEGLPYYGGYTDVYSEDTHTFDNLLALLAERKGIDETIF
ncbi:glycosyl hydrolase family 8 [Sporosarcina newyorkensis]|uniref:Endo-1,4-beta-D-glucanase Y n=1 Tax=Sporosarcina newyorkensis TaxID=759851 RepID=A0A1T4YB68_9BACL|nr:glycosyl hydrolase family 8 [Sporosarcina newyorkensis]SKA99082.1 Endo-1,4-beta-D-glucanase Y [Sporosarcina newyorkensis]